MTRDGVIIDTHTGWPMSGPLLRAAELFLCVGGKPYPIGRDEAVLRQSNQDLTRFLASVFAVQP